MNENGAHNAICKIYANVKTTDALQNVILIKRHHSDLQLNGIKNGIYVIYLTSMSVNWYFNLSSRKYLQISEQFC